ncbi:MAG: hypothetical protein JNL25_16375 [Rhodospirillaceae bacterium]|nr:hypothetical protein [Rhodospirillaceae bacterium]
MAKAETESKIAELEAVVASELDELTHAEMLEFYRASNEAIRFAKHQQWATLVGSLGLFVLLGVIGNHAYKGTILFKLVILISLVLSAGAIYSLVIYQFWQNSEREKLALITTRLSNLAQAVRALVSERERNVHRYVLLFFMMTSIVLANALLIVYLSPKL